MNTPTPTEKAEAQTAEDRAQHTPGPTRYESGEYLAPIDSVQIYKPDIHPIEKMIRLYCTQWGSTWKLQIRGPLSIGCNGTKKGKSSILANADLNLEGMISLRDALGEFIAEAQTAIAKAEGKSAPADAIKELRTVLARVATRFDALIAGDNYQSGDAELSQDIDNALRLAKAEGRA